MIESKFYKFSAQDSEIVEEIQYKCISFKLFFLQANQFDKLVNKEDEKKNDLNA